LGWLLESFTDAKGLEQLRKTALEREIHASLLDPKSPNTVQSINKSWNLKINRKVEPDV
jgi:hypothetical protein